MNLIDVTRELGTDEECFAFLEKKRWPDGVRCAVCGNNRISRIERKSKTKNIRKNLYQCLEPTCKQQFSVTSGTIFHDSRTPLSTWFMAISFIMDAKKGISAKQLQQHLGLGSYQTAWHMCHRIREAMQDTSYTKMKGIVEIDETYIGGKTRRRGRPRKIRSEQFDMVVGMRERGGRVRFFHTPDAKKDTIKKIVDRHISPQARIMTDQATVYPFAFDKGFRKRHTTVNHSREWVAPDRITHTNTVESAFSLLKRGLIGSFHRVSIKHLHRYLSEFELRFNERKDVDRFEKMVSRTAQTAPLTYQKLIAEPNPEQA